MKTHVTTLLLSLLIPALLGLGVWAASSSRQPQASSPSVHPAVPAPQREGRSIALLATPRTSEPEVSAPAGALPFRLVGVFSSGIQSVALLQDLEEKGIRSYRADDALPHGARLLRIALKEADLRGSDGRVHTLKLEEAASLPPREPITRLSQTERLVDVGLLRQQPVQALLEFSQVKVAPRLEQGRVLGFGVHGVAPEGILNDLGLEDGDVVSAVDGQPLENYQRAAELFDRLIQQESSTVTLIKKGGKRRVFTYHLVT